jgi:hypothetical protein
MNVQALYGLLAIAGILLLFYGPWQTFCVDVFRQYSFHQRDKLFDLAADGQVDFDSTEYRTARSNIEATIRFAHKATFARVMFLWKFCPELGKGSIDPSLSEPYAKYLRNVRVTMILAMLMRSGPVIIILIVTLPAILISALYVYIANQSSQAVIDQAKRSARFIRRSQVFDAVALRAEIESHCV